MIVKMFFACHVMHSDLPNFSGCFYKQPEMKKVSGHMHVTDLCHIPVSYLLSVFIFSQL